jgi:hypothetical protein
MTVFSFILNKWKSVAPISLFWCEISECNQIQIQVKEIAATLIATIK